MSSYAALLSGDYSPSESGNNANIHNTSEKSPSPPSHENQNAKKSTNQSQRLLGKNVAKKTENHGKTTNCAAAPANATKKNNDAGRSIAKRSPSTTSTATSTATASSRSSSKASTTSSRSSSAASHPSSTSSSSTASANSAQNKNKNNTHNKSIVQASKAPPSRGKSNNDAPKNKNNNNQNKSVTKTKNQPQKQDEKKITKTENSRLGPQRTAAELSRALQRLESVAFLDKEEITVEADAAYFHNILIPHLRIVETKKQRALQKTKKESDVTSSRSQILQERLQRLQAEEESDRDLNHRFERQHLEALVRSLERDLKEDIAQMAAQETLRAKYWNRTLSMVTRQEVANRKNIAFSENHTRMQVSQMFEREVSSHLMKLRKDEVDSTKKSQTAKVQQWEKSVRSNREQQQQEMLLSKSSILSSVYNSSTNNVNNARKNSSTSSNNNKKKSDGSVVVVASAASSKDENLLQQKADDASSKPPPSDIDDNNDNKNNNNSIRPGNKNNSDDDDNDDNNSEPSPQRPSSAVLSTARGSVASSVPTTTTTASNSASQNNNVSNQTVNNSKPNPKFSKNSKYGKLLLLQNASNNNNNSNKKNINSKKVVKASNAPNNNNDNDNNNSQQKQTTAAFTSATSHLQRFSDEENENMRFAMIDLELDRREEIEFDEEGARSSIFQTVSHSLVVLVTKIEKEGAAAIEKSKHALQRHALEMSVVENDKRCKIFSEEDAAWRYIVRKYERAAAIEWKKYDENSIRHVAHEKKLVDRRRRIDNKRAATMERVEMSRKILQITDPSAVQVTSTSLFSVYLSQNNNNNNNNRGAANSTTPTRNENDDKNNNSQSDGMVVFEGLSPFPSVVNSAIKPKPPTTAPPPHTSRNQQQHQNEKPSFLPNIHHRNNDDGIDTKTDQQQGKASATSATTVKNINNNNTTTTSRRRRDLDTYLRHREEGFTTAFNVAMTTSTTGNGGGGGGAQTARAVSSRLPSVVTRPGPYATSREIEERNRRQFDAELTVRMRNLVNLEKRRRENVEKAARMEQYQIVHENTEPEYLDDRLFKAKFKREMDAEDRIFQAEEKVRQDDLRGKFAATFLEREKHLMQRIANVEATERHERIEMVTAWRGKCQMWSGLRNELMRNVKMCVSLATEETYYRRQLEQEANRHGKAVMDAITTSRSGNRSGDVQLASITQPTRKIRKSDVALMNGADDNNKKQKSKTKNGKREVTDEKKKKKKKDDGNKFKTKNEPDEDEEGEEETDHD